MCLIYNWSKAAWSVVKRKCACMHPWVDVNLDGTRVYLKGHIYSGKPQLFNDIFKWRLITIFLWTSWIAFGLDFSIDCSFRRFSHFCLDIWFIQYHQHFYHKQSSPDATIIHALSYLLPILPTTRLVSFTALLKTGMICQWTFYSISSYLKYI